MADTAFDAFKPSPKQTKLVKAKTAKGRRYLASVGPKLVEDAKRALFLYGNNTSQVVKDVVTDLFKLKRLEAVKYSRKNESVQPFEAGGETSLEFYAERSNCGLFVLGSHSKKRPHNLVLGRFFDGRLLDCLELGVERYASIDSFGAAADAQLGNKPAVLFVGDKFESVPELAAAKSLLLDLVRGQVVDSLNLAGLDRVLLVVARDDRKILLRQYSMKYKKSGGRVPRVALTEMGPSLDLGVRRCRLAPTDQMKEALRQPQLGKKKEKNVGSDLLDGKVGRIYMPKQNLETLALSKPKGVKRERRQAAAEAAAPAGGAPAAKKQRAASAANGAS